MVFFLKYLFSLLFILLSVAFFTLFERKILSYVHIRYGPNKVFFLGLFQPFSDAMKLFSKEDSKFKELSSFFYYISPFLCLFLSVFLWVFSSFWGVVFFSKYSLVFFIVIVGAGVYFLLFSGWSSGSKFSLLGSFRSSAQSVSYEVVLIFCLIFFIFLWFTLGVYEFFIFNYFMGLFSVSIICVFSWLLSCLAECNRSPFDFSEGESELVSGFNTEYGGGNFSFIFIGEYSSIILFSFFTATFYFPLFLLFFLFLMLSYFFLWVRSSYPRLRYDLLMMMAWSGLMFLILSPYFIFFIFF